MNLKFLLPTFRNRYRFVQACLEKYALLAQGKPSVSKALNLGTGEGDYDRMLAAYCQQLVGCDVNEDDLNCARTVNADVPNVAYEKNDALNLIYPDGAFDLVVSCEVIEHVGEPRRMLAEIYRVLRPGGRLVMTFPSRGFPFTYDPVNYVWLRLRKPHQREYAIAQGAYAFGHTYLIDRREFLQWADEQGFEVVEQRGLSHYLVGLLEMYHTGLLQRLLKRNAYNSTDVQTPTLAIQPRSSRPPRLAALTDAILWLDRALFGWSRASVGVGVVLRKPHPPAPEFS
ncbi:MAG: methyltransferase domain-containing protein [Saprospiraceae bacterium]|nr:methyltransferase domain-containing protein [Saprospiraceae bacterium]MDW8228433.1 methyltransferase domain-containing protein [Saprospiraceae bacterium]